MGSNINVTLGNWSEWFMLLAAMTYLVVFVAFVWDMASHSKTLGLTERARRDTAEGEAKELVGATAAHSGARAAGSATVGSTVSRSAFTRSSTGGASGDGAGTGESVADEFRTSADGTKGVNEFEALDYQHNSRRPAARVAVTLMVIAFLLHAFAVVSRGVAADRVPWANM